jgi:tryptophan-rich sensory protein
MDWPSLGVTAAVVVAAAALGNLLIPKAAMDWFRNLTWPRWLIPFRVFIVVGVVYYALMAVVLYRALERADIASVVWSVVVIVANEVWNLVFFGLRSTLGGFLGILGFAVPLAVLLYVARQDMLSMILLSAYGVWVLYDVAWTFALWRRNSTVRTPPPS